MSLINISKRGYKFVFICVLQDDRIHESEMPALFFYEYAEGSSNNKYLEIFNPTQAEISLADTPSPTPAMELMLTVFTTIGIRSATVLRLPPAAPI